MVAGSFEDTDSLYDFVVRDGYGVKGMMDLPGPEMVPKLFIHPHRDRVDELYTGNSLYGRHSMVDLSMLDGAQRSQAVALIADAAETVGFFQVVNHGVPIEVLESLKTVAHEFFGQSPEKKAVYRKGVSPCSYVRYVWTLPRAGDPKERAASAFSECDIDVGVVPCGCVKYIPKLSL